MGLSSARVRVASATFVLSAALSILAVACDGPQVTPEGRRRTESHFAVLPVDKSTSILPALESTNGKPSVCVGLIGFGKNQSRAEERTKGIVTDAANKWNRLLEGNDQWNVTKIDPVYAVQSTECLEKNGADFSINVWASVQGFKSEFCAARGMSEDNCSAATFTSMKTFYTGPWNRTIEVEAIDPFTLMHEYGHLLGMGDTYKIPGMHDWEGEQPASVMNGYSVELTDDDQLGLWAVMRALKTGQRSCEGFGTEHAMTANGFEALLCDPKATPTMTHEGRPNL